MDKIIGNIKNGLKNNETNSNNPQQGQHQPQQQGGNNQQGEDYLDKAFDRAEQRVGGGKIDHQKLRNVNEKITDAARGEFEKATGKHVPDKVSN